MPSARAWSSRPTTVVTNCHVTREARADHTCCVAACAGRCDAQASDLDRDLCLLQVPGLRAQPVALGTPTDAEPGQPVTALGYTGGLGMQNSAGEVRGTCIASTARGDPEHQLVQLRRQRRRPVRRRAAAGGHPHLPAARRRGALLRRAGGMGRARCWTTTQRGSFREVMPLDSQPLPYWQAARAAQPRFLQGRRAAARRPLARTGGAGRRMVARRCARRRTLVPAGPALARHGPAAARRSVRPRMLAGSLERRRRSAAAAPRQRPCPSVADESRRGDAAPLPRSPAPPIGPEPMTDPRSPFDLRRPGRGAGRAVLCLAAPARRRRLLPRRAGAVHDQPARAR